MRGVVRRKSVERGTAGASRRQVKRHDPFKFLKISREIIRLAVEMDLRFPLSLRNVEDRKYEFGIEIPQKVNETLRPTRDHRDRQNEIILCCSESHR